MKNVYTVLSISFNHTKEYVYKLKRSLEKNSTVPFRFFCLTNEQLPGIDTIPIKETGRWAKMDLCGIETNDDMLYFDLDTVLIGNIDFLLNETRSFMSKSFDGKKRSQIMSLSRTERDFVWDFWSENRNSIIENFRGEGSVYDFVLGERLSTLQEIYPGSVINFREASEFISVGSKLITFSGEDYPGKIEETNHIKKYW